MIIDQQQNGHGTLESRKANEPYVYVVSMTEILEVELEWMILNSKSAHFESMCGRA